MGPRMPRSPSLPTVAQCRASFQTRQPWSEALTSLVVCASWPYCTLLSGPAALGDGEDQPAAEGQAHASTVPCTLEEQGVRKWNPWVMVTSRTRMKTPSSTLHNLPVQPVPLLESELAMGYPSLLYTICLRKNHFFSPIPMHNISKRNSIPVARDLL